MSFGLEMAKARREREELDPADYEFSGEYYVGPNEEMVGMMNREWAIPNDFDRHEDMGKCDHCGTWHHFGAIFRDKKAGSYLVIGNVCAGQFFDFPSKKAYIQAQAAKKTKARLLAEANRAAGEAFLASRLDLQEAFQVDHRIIADIRAKLFKYGSISEKQAAFVLKLALEELEREPEPTSQPIPEGLLDGRHEFSGTILGFKEKASDWGTVCKMLFRDDRGFKLYGTAPNTDGFYGKGARLSFVARAERSKDDPAFGFFSRPTKVKVFDPGQSD